jgi:hypothetical protein
MRDPLGASIVFISPPTEEKRKAQQHWDVFKHAVKPAIDPENYLNPPVESLINPEPPVTTPQESEPGRVHQAEI